MYIMVLACVGVTAWSALWVFMVVSAFFIPFTLLAETYDAAIELPKVKPIEIWNGMAMVFAKGIVAGGGLVTGGWWALSHFPLYGTLYNNWWLIIAATFLTDLGYYTIHRTVSHGRGSHPLLKYLKRQHAAHHSVSELDFLRGNQSSFVDTAVSQFQPSLILIAWLLGMDLGPTLVAYALILALQATDHTSVTFNIGWLSYIFMDNHAHKLHHCKRGNLINHAAAFSLYDRLLGTYYEDWNLSSNHLHHHKIALPIIPAPQVIFTEPEIAAVGLTKAQARAHGLQVRVVNYDIGRVAGAALYADGYKGHARMVVGAARGVIVGMTMVGPAVGELIHAATIAVVGAVPVDRLWHAVPAYPTVSEIWLRRLETLEASK